MKTLFLIFCFLLAACSDDSFRKVESVDRFRILAIESDDSELAPGDSTNVRLFISDPVGAGSTVNFNIETCVDPGIGVGADISCDHDPAATTGTLNVNTGTLGTLNTGATANVSVTVPATILAGRDTISQINGVGYIVIFSATIDGRKVKAFRRILGTNRATLNNNPVITQLELNGSLFDGSTPLEKNDELSVIADTPESYSVILIDGTTENRTEEYQVAWYVSKGELNRPKVNVGEKVEYISETPTESIVVIAVVRDERGGLAVQEVVIP